MGSEKLKKYFEEPEIGLNVLNTAIAFFYGPLINNLDWVGKSNIVRTIFLGLSSVIGSTLNVGGFVPDKFILEPVATGVINGIFNSIIPAGAGFKSGTVDGVVISEAGSLVYYGWLNRDNFLVSEPEPEPRSITPTASATTPTVTPTVSPSVSTSA